MARYSLLFAVFALCLLQGLLHVAGQEESEEHTQLSLFGVFDHISYVSLYVLLLPLKVIVWMYGTVERVLNLVPVIGLLAVLCVWGAMYAFWYRAMFVALVQFTLTPVLNVRPQAVLAAFFAFFANLWHGLTHGDWAPWLAQLVYLPNAAIDYVMNYKSPLNSAAMTDGSDPSVIIALVPTEPPKAPSSIFF